MDMKTRTIALWSGVAVLVVAGIVILSLAFGGKDTAVDDVNAIYTNAASTIAAQQQTLQAGMATATPKPTLSTPTTVLTLLPVSTQASALPTFKPVGGSTTGGATTGGSTTGGTTACDNAVYLSDVTIPDETTIPAGQNFTKTWKVSNIGTCTWTATYQLVFVSGDSLGGKATAIGKTVKPGESADVSVILTSTSATGIIKGTWKLSNDKAQAFGDGLTVVIKNGAATGSATPTPTKTASGSASATPTPTPTPTSNVVIVVVTATYTPTPTPTPTTPAPTDTPTPTPTPTGSGAT
jgi:hypothetical protein